MRDAGYAAVFHGQKSYNGVAILAKEEPREVRMGFCDEVEDPQARIIAATVGDVRVISVYVPNGQAVGSPAYQYKMEWYRRLTSCLRKESALERVVVCGDFNVAPNDDDVHDPALWHGRHHVLGRRAGGFSRARAISGSPIRSGCIIRRPGFSAGGIIGCWLSRRIAVCASMRFSPEASWRRNAPTAGVAREMRKGKDPSDHAPVWAEFSS